MDQRPDEIIIMAEPECRRGGDKKWHTTPCVRPRGWPLARRGSSRSWSPHRGRTGPALPALSPPRSA